MRRYSFLILFITIYAAVLGFVLRRQELRTAFESHSGLSVHGAEATVMLILLSISFLLAIALLSIYITRHYRAPDDYEDVFGTHTILYPLTFTAIGIFWICGTVINIVDLRAANTLQTIDVYFAILSLLAANSIIFLSVEIYQGLKNKSPYALSVIPIVFLCFWLILLYRNNAANPVMLAYVYQCLAIIFSTIGFYYTTGFVYKKPSIGRAVFSYSGTILFCGTSLADNLSRGNILIMCAITATASMHLLMLLRHLRPKPKTETDKIEN